MANDITHTDRPEDHEHAPPPGVIWRGYAKPHHPLGGCAVLAATFGTALGGGVLTLSAFGRGLPERPALGDLLLLGVATHKLSRLVARDRVTRFARAPFTRFQQDTARSTSRLGALGCAEP